MTPLIARHRDFRLLWFGETTSEVGSSVTTVALPLTAVTVLHASALTAALLTAAAWLPWLLIGLPAGAWVERSKSRRSLMIRCNLVSAALFASVPLAAATHVLTSGQLLAVALCAGACTVFFSTAYRVYLVDLVDHPGDRARANSALQGSESAAQVAGPGLGGLLVAAFGAAIALLADSFSFLVSTWCLLRIRRPEAQRPESPDRSLRREIAGGVRFVRGDPFMRPLVMFGALANFALIGYQALLVVFLVRGVGEGSAMVGLLLALVSSGGLFGALLANPLSRHLGSGRALMLTKVVGAPFALLIPLTGPGARLSLLVVAGVVVGAGVVAGNVIGTSFLQTYCPTDLYARVSATRSVVNYGTIPLGAVLAGVLADRLGVIAALWITTGLFALSALLFFAFAPAYRSRELPAAPAPAPGRELIGSTARPQRRQPQHANRGKAMSARPF